MSLQGVPPGTASLPLNEIVTLPAINQKTQQKILLTLAVKEVLTLDRFRSHYAVQIKKPSGEWLVHREAVVSPKDTSDRMDRPKLVNFAVTKITPVP